MDTTPLSRWENFYVIVGSSAGALTGLQFVVITLIAQGRAGVDKTSIRAFGSPTVVHFCMVLLLAGIISAPWTALSSAALALLVCAAFGFVYAMFVVRHARRQNSYEPDREDWLFYVIVPLMAYALLVASAILLESRPEVALFITGGTSLLLLFLGIRNAWDTVTYIAIDRAAKANSTEHRREAKQSPSEDLRKSA